jgi:hypothetical protein
MRQPTIYEICLIFEKIRLHGSLKQDVLQKFDTFQSNDGFFIRSLRYYNNLVLK